MKRAKAQLFWGRLAALVAGLAFLIQAVGHTPAQAKVIEVCTAHGIEVVLVAADDAMPSVVAPKGGEHANH